MSEYWNKVREELKKAAQEGWEVLKEGAKKASEKSEEMAKITKLRYNIYSKHKEAEHLFGDLGGKVYELAIPPFENPLSNTMVKEIIEKIRAVESEAAKLEQEIQNIKKKEGNGGKPPQTSAS